MDLAVVEEAYFTGIEAEHAGDPAFLSDRKRA
jgi:hypothetical protein